MDSGILNKSIYPLFEPAVLAALTHYPELYDTKIKFRPAKSRLPMFSIVEPSSVLQRAWSRTYIVNITTEIKPKERKKCLFQYLDFNKQIAAIGHELAHILDYLTKNSAGILKTAVLYNFHYYKRKLEHKMDLTTIHHQLGQELYEHSLLVQSLQKMYPHDSYFKTYFKFYMTPSEIQDEMIKMNGVEV
jgi:hypothetical protein